VDKLKEIIVRICQTLNNCNVQYLIIGGSAVALHGYFRMSKGPNGEPSDKFDLDFWYNPTYSNYFNLLNALENLGEDVSDFRDEKTPDPHKSFFKFQYDAFTLDFLPSCGANLKFAASFNTCDRLMVDGTEIPYVNLDDLILIKECQGRLKDNEDLEVLKALRFGEDSDKIP
jgi:hypothetical protein